MATEATPTYRMTLSLNVLNHLGLGLYSNVPAVLSEAVANAWDADATRVIVDIDPNGRTVTIEDDGHGMTVDDANDKFLFVGYERRRGKDGAITPRFGRTVMGRKGIGKLSLFSIAEVVEVHSVKDEETHGFRMDVKKIRQAIESGANGRYCPPPISPANIDLSRGTRIRLSQMKRRLYRSSSALRRRLARRFSVIGGDYDFEIVLDGQPVTIEDREYQDKLQYIWTYGKSGERTKDMARRLHDEDARCSEIEVDEAKYEIDGWIGTVHKVKQLSEPDTKESLNKILIMVRGKLAQEDILDTFGIGGLPTKYIIGEIHADFLDLDDKDDIATTSRQQIIEEDPRYVALRSKIELEVRNVVSEWQRRRNAGGTDKARQVPQINAWYRGLNPDHRKAARKLLGRINEIPIDEPSEMRPLFIGSILAFESLKFRHMLHRLDKVSTENLAALGEVFAQLDDLEASAYFQIANDRLAVIRKLTNLVDDNAKEKALQKHLYTHLWLLDPSWERAAKTERMEKGIHNALGRVYGSLTEEQRRSRLDIYYATTGNKHMIIELKRAGRVVDTGDLVSQIIRYRGAALNTLRDLGRGNEPLEFVCVVGRRLRDWDDNPDGEADSRQTLEGQNARVVLYDQLIDNAQQAYQDYIDRQDEAGKLYRLISSISDEDIEAMSPPPD